MYVCMYRDGVYRYTYVYNRVCSSRLHKSYCDRGPHIMALRTGYSPSASHAHAMHGIEAWKVEHWKDEKLAPKLTQLFEKLKYNDKIDAMIKAYEADPTVNLGQMIQATGNVHESEDVNYVWTSWGRMALLMELGRNKPDERPAGLAFLGEEILKYDDQLRAWTVDLGGLHAEVMKYLEMENENEMQVFIRKCQGWDEIEKERREFDVNEICQNGDWKNGIMMQPIMKFSIVTKWLKKYCNVVYDAANKMRFHRSSEEREEEHIQIKEHRTCIFFKNDNYAAGVEPNPEFAEKGTEKLRNDLPNEVYDEMQFTLEIVGKDFNGKITYVSGSLYVIPVSPKCMKHDGVNSYFDPRREDDGVNSYFAFKGSHTNTRSVSPCRRLPTGL